MLSRKHWRLPKPSAERQTLSPVPVHDKHTMSSCKHFFSIRISNPNNHIAIYLHDKHTMSSRKKSLVQRFSFFLPMCVPPPKQKNTIIDIGSASPQTAYTSYSAHTAYTDQIVCITLLSLLTLLLMLSLNTLL